MKLSDFILLSVEEKAAAVLHQGVLVAKRRHQEQIAFLFHLENYYVETFCSVEKKGIEEFRVFDNTKCLNPYLEAIPIGDLLN
jgi:hypothetical protein